MGLKSSEWWSARVWDSKLRRFNWEESSPWVCWRSPRAGLEQNSMLYIHIKKRGGEKIWWYFLLYDAEINLSPHPSINLTPRFEKYRFTLLYTIFYLFFLLPININHHKGLMFSSILLQNDHKSNALLKFWSHFSPPLLNQWTHQTEALFYQAIPLTTVDALLSCCSRSHSVPALFSLDYYFGALSLTSSSSSSLRSAVLILPFGAVSSPPYTSVEMPWQHCGGYFILRDYKLNSRNTLYRCLFSGMQINFARGKINIFN